MVAAGPALPGSPKLKNGDLLTAVITHINSTKQFFVQDVRSAGLIGLITFYGQQAENLTKEKLKVEELIQGSFYLAKSPHDDQWYRATLNKIDTARKTIRLSMVDFGDLVELPFADVGSKVLILGQRLTAFPPLAILCFWENESAHHRIPELQKLLDAKAPISIHILSSAETGGYYISVPELETEQKLQKQDMSTKQQCSQEPRPVDETKDPTLVSTIAVEQKDVVDAKDKSEDQKEVEKKAPVPVKQKHEISLYKPPPKRDPSPLAEKKPTGNDSKTAQVFKKLVEEANQGGKKAEDNVDTVEPSKCLDSTKAVAAELNRGLPVGPQTGPPSSEVQTKLERLVPEEVQKGKKEKIPPTPERKQKTNATSPDVIGSVATAELGKGEPVKITSISSGTESGVPPSSARVGRVDNDERMNTVFTIREEAHSASAPSARTPAGKGKKPSFSKPAVALDKELLKKKLVEDDEFLDIVVLLVNKLGGFNAE